MTTDQLILRFYYDLMNCQQEETRGERKFELVVSVGYIKEKSIVEVTVIHGENMGECKIIASCYTMFHNSIIYYRTDS